MVAGLTDKRFLVVAGKGGVGKSTVCAALGLAAARRGKRVVIAELNARDKAPQLFGKEPRGYEPLELADNLWALNIRPGPALREYGLRKLKFQKLYELVFDNEPMRKLLRMIPGMNELVMLGKAFDLERETRWGKPTWDLVIVDAPATGHGVSLLRLPEVILRVSKVGPMADEARDMHQLLTDPARTAVHIVTLPEEMPVRETFELLHQVEDELGMPTGWLVVNGVWPEAPSEEDLAMLDALGLDDPVVGGAAKAATSLARRRAMQDGYLTELAREVALPQVHLPYLFRDHFDAQAVGELAELLGSAHA